MKKLSKIFCISATAIAMMFSMTCNTNAQMDGSKFSKSKNIEIELKVVGMLSPTTPIEQLKKELLNDLNKKQNPVGRYSNITPDKKIDWTKKYKGKSDIPGEKYKDKGYRKKTLDMMNKITLDGKNIKFPVSFDSLGNKYKEFNNVDYLNFTNKMNHIIINNIKNGYFVAATVLNSRNDKNEDWNYRVYSMMFSEEDFLFSFTLDARDKKIISIASGYGIYPGVSDLRVDNIGLGNTLNEMYAKFGEPTLSLCGDDMVIVSYVCVDSNGKRCIIEFKSKSIWDGEKYLYPKANVITEIYIYKDR